MHRGGSSTFYQTFKRQGKCLFYRLFLVSIFVSYRVLLFEICCLFLFACLNFVLFVVFFYVFKFSLDVEGDCRIRRGVFTRRPLRHRNENRGAAVQFRCHTSGDCVTQSLLGDQHERSFGDYHGHTVLRRKDPRVSHALLTRAPLKKMYCELKMFRRTKTMVALFLVK